MELPGGADLGGMELADNVDLGAVELFGNMELSGSQKVVMSHEPHGARRQHTEGRVGRARRRRGLVEVAAAVPRRHALERSVHPFERSERIIIE
jgi:hypothetical protein